MVFYSILVPVFMFHSPIFFIHQRDRYEKGIIGEYTIMEMMDLVANLIDESDPDTSLPNDVHMYQVHQEKILVLVVTR